MGPVVLTLVVYAGVVGPHADRVDRQLGSLLHHDAEISPIELRARDRQSLGTHDDRSGKVAARLGKGGVVAGQVVAGKRSNRLRVYVYDGDGDLRTQVEVPLDGDALDRGGLATLRRSVVADAIALQQGQDADEHVEPPPEEEEPVIVIEEDEAAESAGEADAEADAESVDEDAGEEPDDSAFFLAQEPPPLHMGATVGLGLISRSFVAGSPAIPGYDASGVGSARFAGDIEPTERTRLDFVTERSFGMTTAIMGESTPTSLTRWEAQASWAVIGGRLSLAPALGVGRRRFGIASTAPSRSPDGDYLYLLAGARSSLTLGKRTMLAANLRVEPVIGGEQSTMAAYGSASRWALDLGVTLDVCLRPWLVLRGDLGYQAFQWTFSDGSGATDRYLSATFSLGTRY